MVDCLRDRPNHCRGRRNAEKYVEEHDGVDGRLGGDDIEDEPGQVAFQQEGPVGAAVVEPAAVVVVVAEVELLLPVVLGVVVEEDEEDEEDDASCQVALCVTRGGYHDRRYQAP